MCFCEPGAEGIFFLFFLVLVCYICLMPKRCWDACAYALMERTYSLSEGVLFYSIVWQALGLVSVVGIWFATSSYIVGDDGGTHPIL
jgi:hypothetical protein